MAKKLLSTLLCVVLMASSVVMASAADTSKAETGADTVYSTASQALDEKYGYNENDLGATYTKDGTTFKVWAPTATDIKVNLYATGSDKEENAKDLGSYKLSFDDKTGVWSKTVEGDLLNKFYTYTVTAKNVTGSKLTTKETADVYSVATGVNGERSQIVDLDSTDPDGWDKDAHVLPDKATDSFVWEIHVKDFSYAKNSGVSDAHRGKYLAFTETGTTLNNEGKVATMVDYLKNLGVTAVQINPFYDFGSVKEDGADSQFNWGYDPMNYNVPEGSYSTNPYDGNVRINECKQMVQALHNAGIGVIMDVVYNHTFNTNTSFEACVPNYYYRMNKDGSYSNGSGCGNETASERLMFRNFMIQSCLYWVNEYHIDGFRFDLMALHDSETMNLLRDALDEVDPRITLWGEGWTGGSSTYPSKTCTGQTFFQTKQTRAGALRPTIGFFSDAIRDGLKGSVFDKKAAAWLQGGGSFVTISQGAQAKPANYNARVQSQVVTYDSCHDNQTLWDRLCDSQGLQDYFRKRNPILVAENKLAGGILNMMQGVTFVLAGEEMGRSKDNDENSYKSAATENMIDWSLAQSNADIVSYYAGMRAIRKAFSPLRAAERKGYDYNDYAINGTYSDTGTVISSEGYAAVWTNQTEGEWNKLLVIANNKEKDTSFTLEDANKDWIIIADGNQAGVKKLGENTTNKFDVPARSFLIAVDKASFESVGVKSEMGAVNVKAVNTITDTVIDSYTITGKIGSSYSIAMPDSLGAEYELASVSGAVDGTFKAEDQNVVLNFAYYAPESVKKDINGDGKVNIKDATFVQRGVAKAIEMSEAETKLADVNLDGAVTVDDVTMIQRYLTDMSVGSGTVTVNYYKDGTDEKIADSVVFKGKVGETYKASPASALGYKVNEEKMPKEEITVPYGNIDVNYYYTKGSSIVNIYVKHSGKETWAPNLWIWGSKNGSDTSSNYSGGSWPGAALTKKDDKGWFQKTFSANSGDDSYNVIVSNNANPQSGDCKGFVQSNLWVVIDDSKDGVALDFYDVNPDENPGVKPFAQG